MEARLSAGGEPPPEHTRARGRAAEDLAVEHLVAHGYVLVARNVLLDPGELDLVARDGDTLCFVEVKARENALCGLAVEGIGPRQRRRIVRAATLYLALHRWDGPCRFDVLGLDRDAATGEWRYTLLRDAFDAF